jgi:uncharacterized iron-regulated membrane protein
MFKMLNPRSLKLWCVVHRWTSLICTLFLFILCLTGLPLIFHEELDQWLGQEVSAPAMPAGTPQLSVDRLIAAGMERHPKEFIQYVVWDDDAPNLLLLNLASAPDAPPTHNRIVAVDARTGKVLQERGLDTGVTSFLLRLHTDLFAGLGGKLFLGLMGVLFVVALVSGVVIYGPFMRKLEFGAVRRDRSARLKWLDLHNLLGIVSLTWALAVGATGVINTWADLLIQIWRFDQLGKMVAPYKNLPPLEQNGSLARALETAQRAAPGMKPGFVAFPGTQLTSRHHYMFAMKGNTPLTSRVVRPVLVDAGTAELTAARELPWYMKALLVSQPLHFGDYGGMPLKVAWALLDGITLVVLGSGLYLWVRRRHVPLERRLAELVPDEPRLEAVGVAG